MRPTALVLLLSLLAVFTLSAPSTVKARTPLTLEVLDDRDEVVETMTVPADSIAEATSGFDQTGQPVLTIRFDERVRAAFGALTQRHLYKKMRMRVGAVVLSPGARIMSPIHGGSVQLSGLDTAEIEKIKSALGR